MYTYQYTWCIQFHCILLGILRKNSCLVHCHISLSDHTVIPLYIRLYLHNVINKKDKYLIRISFFFYLSTFTFSYSRSLVSSRTWATFKTTRQSCTISERITRVAQAVINICYLSYFWRGK